MTFWLGICESTTKLLLGFEPLKNRWGRRLADILIDLDYISATCVTGWVGVDICDRIQWITWATWIWIVCCKRVCCYDVSVESPSGRRKLEEMLRRPYLILPLSLSLSGRERGERVSLNIKRKKEVCFFTHGVWLDPTRAETPWVNPCVSCRRRRREWPRPTAFSSGSSAFFFFLSLSPLLFPFSFDSSTPFHTSVYMILILCSTHAGVNFPFGPLDPRPSSRHYLYLYVFRLAPCVTINLRGGL